MRYIIAALALIVVLGCDGSKDDTKPAEVGTASPRQAVATPSTRRVRSQSSPVPTPHADPNSPSDAAVKDFAVKFSNKWLGVPGEKDAVGHITAHTVRDITKRTTDSIMHPTVWTVIVDDSTADPHATFSFNFFWDGSRFVASDSSYIDAGSQAATSLSTARLDEAARQIQSQ